MHKTRKSPPRPDQSRSRIDLAAIAICEQVYDGSCACSKSPTKPVCGAMKSAALYAAIAICGDDHIDLLKQLSARP